MIDERFRRMLMMDYATKEGQNNQGFFGGNLTGGLLASINPTLLIGADIIGSGVKGKDPFSSLIPALTKTAKIKQALTPKKGGQSIRFNPQTGEFEITSGGAIPTATTTMGGGGHYNQPKYVAGYLNTTSAVDAIQFSMASGNIDAGDICLYGIGS